MYKFVLLLSLVTYDGEETRLGKFESPSVFENHHECITSIMALDFTDFVYIDSKGYDGIAIDGTCIKTN